MKRPGAVLDSTMARDDIVFRRIEVLHRPIQETSGEKAARAAGGAFRDTPNSLKGGVGF
jgi:hypothetical protein